MSDTTTVQIRASTLADYAVIASIYNEAITAGSITFDTRQFEAKDIQAWVDKFCDREYLLVIRRQPQILGWGIVKQ